MNVYLCSYDLMSGLVGILLSVLAFTSVVHKNGIDSMHPVVYEAL